jgi:predicted component of type VI protein secretion system
MTYTAWLTVAGPPLDGQAAEWQLEKDEYLIGREAPADLVIPLPRVSRSHARIVRDAGGYAICDLESRNGTYVNGKPIGSAPVPLKDGDQIVLGGTIELRFHAPRETVQGPRIGRLKGVWLDEAAREVWVDGERVDPPLSAAQLTLLTLLYRSAGQVISRAQIVAAVWPDSNPAGVGEEAIDGMIKRLRARLRAAQPDREYLEVLRGHGLRLVPPDL